VCRFCHRCSTRWVNVGRSVVLGIPPTVLVIDP